MRTRKATARTLAVTLLAIAFLIPAPARAQEDATGVITGTVRDDFNAMTLPTANVRVLDTEISVITDIDGAYRLEVPAGTYTLEVSMAGYTTTQLTDVVVAAGQTVNLDVVMELEGLSLEENVVVTATAEPELSTSAGQLLERKRAAMITDNLAREEMRANADSDAAAAMKRVTGLSVVDNQYVYVRGLGERYSNTMLNGSILPTTEPDKRVVPLDLIPTNLIQSVQVVKSYMPDRPAEFSGGLIQIESLRAPRQTAWTVSSKQTFNTQSAFKDGLTYQGGGRDWLGFDDGTRAIPDGIPSDQKVVRRGLFSTRGFTPEQLETFGESFNDIWQPYNESQSQDQDYSSGYGTRMGDVGLALSLGYKTKARTRTEDRTYYQIGEDDDGNPILEPQNEYNFNQTEARTRLGAVGNLSWEASPQNRFSWANFWTHNSRNETRYFDGYNDDIATDIQDTRLYWVQEDILSSTLRGEHLIPSFLNSRIDWRLNYSRAKRDEPDLREVFYEYNPSNRKFVLADESQSAFRMFNYLDDRVYDAGLDWNVFFDTWAGLPANLKVGGAYTHRERDFSSRRFRFTPRNVIGLDLSLPIEQLLTPANIGPYYELREETRPTDTYSASHDLYAGYGMLDLPLSRKLRLVGGARIESSSQEVQTFDPFAVDPKPITATLDNTDLLPGVNLVYSVTNDMNIRGGYSRTVNRPEFRELSPFEFTDVVGGFAIVGNSNLSRALIDNFDLRWEWFPSADEVVAVSGFYKKFTDPIERVIEPTAQLRISFDNAKGARNEGVELELRKRLGRYFAFNLNYTYVDSRIELTQKALQVQTSLVRPLTGQSPHVVNAILSFDLPDHGFSARALFNYFGRRITEVGALSQPDIYEENRGTIDAVLEKHFGQLGVQLLGSNLTNAHYLFTQGGLEQRSYKVGRDYAFRLSYTIF